MHEASTRRHVGMFGIVASLLVFSVVPLYFVYSGAPPDWNILTRSLVGITGCTVFLVFFAGLRQLIHQVDPSLDWHGSVLQMAGSLWVAVVYVPQSMEVGAAISVDRDIDTTTEGPFAAAQYLLQGGVSRLLMALFLITLALVVRRSGMLPGWVATSGFVLAVINLAFLPAVFFGDDAADFYSAQGWGTTATMGLFWSLWSLAVSISILRSAKNVWHLKPAPAPREPARTA